jgi:hypothetical protein
LHLIENKMTDSKQHSELFNELFLAEYDYLNGRFKMRKRRALRYAAIRDQYKNISAMTEVEFEKLLKDEIRPLFLRKIQIIDSIHIWNQIIWPGRGKGGKAFCRNVIHITLEVENVLKKPSWWPNDCWY